MIWIPKPENFSCYSLSMKTALKFLY